MAWTTTPMLIDLPRASERARGFGMNCSLSMAALPASRQGEGVRRVNEGWQAGMMSPRELPPLHNADDDLDNWGLSSPKPKIVVPPEGILLEDLFQ